MILRLIVGVAVGVTAGALLGYYGKCTSGACPLTANPYRGAIYGGLMGVLFTFTMSGGVSGKRVELPDGEQKALHIDSVEAFEQKVINGSVPSLVDFYSDRCGPCRRLAPTVELLARAYEGRAMVCKVDVDAVPEVTARYGVRGIPAVIFFQKGKEMERLVGLRPENEYTAVLDRLTKL